MDLLKGLVDDKLLRILILFINNPDELYHINKVAKNANVPLTTTFRLIKDLLDNNIIEAIKISKFKVYKLSKNQKTKSLKKLI